VLAFLLVGVLIALQFFPSGQAQLMTATETLAISVVAFYFGLHGGTTGVSGEPVPEGTGPLSPKPKPKPVSPEDLDEEDVGVTSTKPVSPGTPKEPT
jgi:hypothetical protein